MSCEVRLRWGRVTLKQTTDCVFKDEIFEVKLRRSHVIAE